MTAQTIEEVVLLDEHGNAVGTCPKSEVHNESTPLRLAFSCYVIDESGRVLVTKRALHKETWPGAWTNSCCGHPAPGESVEDAVRRRTRQELGIELTDLRPALPDFRYRAVMDNGIVENEVCPVYVAVCTEPDDLSPDPAEVAAIEWHDWAAFRSQVLSGERDVSPWCALQVAELPEELAD